MRPAHAGPHHALQPGGSPTPPPSEIERIDTSWGVEGGCLNERRGRLCSRNVLAAALSAGASTTRAAQMSSICFTGGTVVTTFVAVPPRPSCWRETTLRGRMNEILVADVSRQVLVA